MRTPWFEELISFALTDMVFLELSVIEKFVYDAFYGNTTPEELLVLREKLNRDRRFTTPYQNALRIYYLKIADCDEEYVNKVMESHTEYSAWIEIKRHSLVAHMNWLKNSPVPIPD